MVKKLGKGNIPTIPNDQKFPKTLLDPEKLTGPAGTMAGWIKKADPGKREPIIETFFRRVEKGNLNALDFIQAVLSTGTNGEQTKKFANKIIKLLPVLIRNEKLSVDQCSELINLLPRDLRFPALASISKDSWDASSPTHIDPQIYLIIANRIQGLNMEERVAIDRAATYSYS
ncbi:hypothetical protein KJ780_01305 [Candidatus Micrarchaeota archaeon]|nr:hypothetical protein [Candidatus Micrarchaeota archaeon]